METRGARVMMTAYVLGALLLHTQCAARAIHLEIHLLGFTSLLSRTERHHT